MSDIVIREVCATAFDEHGYVRMKMLLWVYRLPRTSGRSPGAKRCTLHKCTLYRLTTVPHGVSVRPYTLLGLFPVGGRSTAIKLATGGVWILASTPLTDETKQKLAELGEVK